MLVGLSHLGWYKSIAFNAFHCLSNLPWAILVQYCKCVECVCRRVLVHIIDCLAFSSLDCHTLPVSCLGVGCFCELRC